MQKKALLSISFIALFLSSCLMGKSTPSKRPSKMRHIVYHKSYENTKDLVEEIGDPNDLDSTAVHQKDVGKSYRDTFTKQRGRSQTSDYRPAEF
jgi:hypothetical protein